MQHSHEQKKSANASNVITNQNAPGGAKTLPAVPVLQKQARSEDELIQTKALPVEAVKEYQPRPLPTRFVAQKQEEGPLTQHKPFQLKADGGMSIQKHSNNTGMPDNLKSGIESLSGFSMDDVKVHYNSDRPAQLQAFAYAQGTDIHIAPGQERHLPHEAWHVVQQKQGRVEPTLQMKAGVAINDDKGLETEADMMGAKALSYTGANQTAPVLAGGTNIQLKVLQAFGGRIIQRVEVPTPFGIFSTEEYKPVIDRMDGTSIGAKAKIVFTPDARCPKNVTIGLIQIVSMTGHQQASSDLQAKLLGQGGGGWAVDRAGDSNPVYGSYDSEETGRSQALTDNPPEPKEGNQFGSTKGKGGAPATLEDEPILPLKRDILQGQHFETRAMVLDGPNTGLILGSVSWGWSKEAGAGTAVCDPFVLVDGSVNFDAAVAAWNQLAPEEGLVPMPGTLTAPVAATKKKGKCYITTACVEYKGLADNCEELTLLRSFRDNYLLHKANGLQLVEIYYKHSPAIVKAIRRREDEEAILERLYAIIKQCADAIKHGDNEFAYQTYCRMVLELKDEFIPKRKITEAYVI